MRYEFLCKLILADGTTRESTLVCFPDEVGDFIDFGPVEYDNQKIAVVEINIKKLGRAKLHYYGA